MKRPFVLAIALAFTVAGIGACKKAEEAPAPATEKGAAPAASSAPAATPGEGAKKEKGKHQDKHDKKGAAPAAPSAPGQAPAQPMPAPDQPET